MQVVDRQHQWLVLGDVQRHPVEAVQDRERGVDGGGVARRSGSDANTARAGAAAPGQRAARAASARPARLEQLAHDAERELALELAGPRHQRRRAAVGGLAARLDQQAVLPTPAGPSISSRVHQLRLELSQLALAFYQVRGGHPAQLEATASVPRSRRVIPSSRAAASASSSNPAARSASPFEPRPRSAPASPACARAGTARPAWRRLLGGGDEVLRGPLVVACHQVGQRDAVGHRAERRGLGPSTTQRLV